MRAAIGTNDSLLAGVSGGADSIAMLLAIHNAGYRVYAVHCNFHLRGEESMRDQHYVELFCQNHKIPLNIIDFNVEQHREQHGVSVEMACRDLRYAEFRNLKRESGSKRILVAHNADDNAETVLLNLMRGSGVSGLRAMRRDTGEILRPMLDISRADIEDYLNKCGVDYVIDSSNLQSDYSRNFIRNQVLPMLRDRWPHANDALNNTAAIMENEEKALSYLEKMIVPQTDILPYSNLSDAEMRQWIIRRFVKKHNGTDHIAADINECMERGELQPGKRWICGDDEFVAGVEGIEYIKAVCDTELQIEATLYENSPELMAEIKQARNNEELWLPYGPEQVKFRLRRDGDRMWPLGMKGSRLVSDIVSDAKLPVCRKRNIIVAEKVDSGEILWVEGLKRSKIDLITDRNNFIYKFVRKNKNY